MGLFEYFRNRNKAHRNYKYELENLDDLMFDAPDQSKNKTTARKNRRFIEKFDLAEEAKLDAQLNEHITDLQLKEQYDKAVKEQYDKAVKEQYEKAEKELEPNKLEPNKLEPNKLESNKFESNKLEKINLGRYSKNDIQKFINSQCEILNETSKHVDEAKEEYSVVTSYFSDIQLIESAPENIRNNISNLAEVISGLTVDRRIFHSTGRNLSNNAYFRMERIEPEMPGVLIQIQNHESYFQTVKKDVRILEGQRASLRYDARDLVKKQNYIKKISMMLISGLFIVFGLLVVLSLMIEDDNNYLFLTVIGLSALFAVGLFAFLKNTERQVIVTEIKLNKTTNILNKTKIKYINSANTLDYEYAKYGIKSSYQLSKEYEAYLEAKREKEKISRLTDKLNDSEVNLELILKGLQLYDPHIWLAQVKALVNPKEMVEVKHELSMRRQKLRMQIEYNMNRLDDVKQDIKRVMVSNPEYTDEILRIIENYENTN